MAKTKRKALAKTKERPLILISGLSGDMVEPTLDLAREWGWDMQGTWVSDGEWLTEREPTGALIKELPNDPLVERLLKAGCPAVRVGARPHRDDDRLPAVLPDLAASGRLAAEHFAVRAFKDVGYVGHNPENPDANTHAMYAEFRKAAEEAGMACHLHSLVANDSDGEPDRLARRGRDLMAWLVELPKPVGILCFNDIMAERIALACAKANLAVPDDVAILGYGDSMQCKITPVRLSSVDPGLENRMIVVMKLLRDLMKGKRPPKEPIMVPPKGIVERRSTTVLAVSNPTVAKALRFIWDNFADDLSVDDIAEAAGVERRRLERGFRSELNRSVREELRRKRLEAVCDLLRTTDNSVADIATKVGYRSPQYLHRAFKTAYGVTPRAYRKG